MKSTTAPDHERRHWHLVRLAGALTMMLACLLGVGTSFMAWLNCAPANEAFWWHYSAQAWNAAFLCALIVHGFKPNTK